MHPYHDSASSAVCAQTGVALLRPCWVLDFLSWWEGLIEVNAGTVAQQVMEAVGH